MSRTPPSVASIATQGDGARMVAPAAERNMAALCDLLAQVARHQGRALELASGTGQHVSAFAARLPGLQWQPTEVDAQRRASIDAYCEALDTVAPAQELNATRPGWGADWAGQDLVVLINLLHLISEGEAATLISEAAAALAPGGRLVIYGPFMRAGELTSEGDERFHAALTAQDPEIGYKDDFDIIDRMQEAGLELAEVVEMPANNLALIAEKPRI
ncbi:DUF938 domain-containing protein [Ruegeria pomeroyi]|uniref:Methyltransferase n=2 Tax=Ruegeria pomeroyi TaxID=89184 RepID=Q5LVQ9_RUEPO|nr:DUF938 domain-containing protein [Ruegeria pomeroyi]AAV93948.1 hypothetical protein SPO0641 [Ruegeria pomeroyi DSS-3]NVK98412.1 DUF938 domain-containing protein [Ruegeria pomeroyi]NVL02855.1 DUF938 domain-containing protein [Ruegeria pomeroyi]QWV07537.1 DUF938 domain-containing protein [Ruegeria pomeroyi]